MRSAKRTAKPSAVFVSTSLAESPLAERVGGWPARSAVLSSPNRGRQGGPSPNPPTPRPALLLFLGAFVVTGFLWWAIFSVGIAVWRLAQY